MKFLTSMAGIVILGLLLSLGTAAGLLYAQKAIFTPVQHETLPPKLWSFKTDEVDSLVAELKHEREKLDKRDADMEQTAAHIEAERQELEKVKATIQALRDEISKEIPQVQEAEIKNLKTLALTYAEMKPPAAVAIFREMDDGAVIKILSFMKPDKVAGVLAEMSHTQDSDDQTMAARAAHISDKLRIVKQTKTQSPSL